MKTSNFIRITLMAASITCIFACKKDSSSSSSSTTSTTSIETAADDQAMVSNENDALDNDAKRQPLYLRSFLQSVRC